jgi:hypothetical protein
MKKKLENVEYLSYVGSLITSNANVDKSRIAMTNAAFNKKTAFQQHIALIHKDKTYCMPRLEHSFGWCRRAGHFGK